MRAYILSSKLKSLIGFCLVTFLIPLGVGAEHVNSHSNGVEPLNGRIGHEEGETLTKGQLIREHSLLLARFAETTTKKLPSQFQSDNLRQANEELTRQVDRLDSEQLHRQSIRDLLDDIGSLISGASNGTNSSDDIGDLLSSGLSSLLNGLTANLSSPTLSLGIGLGAGTAQGLNLTSADRIKSIANSAAAENGALPTGLNLIAQNIGTGLTAAFLPTLDLNSDPDVDFRVIVFSLAQGLGNGTASGLQLTNQRFAPLSGSGISDLAGTLGLGFAQSITESLNMSSATDPASPDGLQDMLMAHLPQALVGAGIGLGAGVADGLGLSKPQVVQANPAPNPSFNISSAAEGFARGLSGSYLQSANIGPLADSPSGTASWAQNMLLELLPGAVGRIGKGLGQGIAQGLGFANDSSTSGPSVNHGGNSSATDIPYLVEEFSRNLASSFLEIANFSNPDSPTSDDSLVGGVNITQLAFSAAAGLGRGLGQGTAIGLGLQTDKNISSSASASGTSDLDVQPLVETFAKGLSMQFLADGTLNRLIAVFGDFMGDSLLNSSSDVNVTKVAEGLARGLLNGASKTIQANSDQAILNTSTILDNRPVDISLASNTTFDDSVGGVAYGFGLGLGEESLTLIQAFLNLPTAQQNESGSTAPPAKTVSLPKNKTFYASRRWIGHESGTKKPLADQYSTVNYEVITTRDTTSLPYASNGTFINDAIQQVVNTLQCEGVGGISVIANTLMSPNSNQAVPLPDIYFTVYSEGNQFDVGLRDTSIAINGLSFRTFTIITALHVAFMVLAFFVVLPIILTLQSVRGISKLVNRPWQPQKADNWQIVLGFFVYLPLVIVSGVIGVVGMGNSSHFRTQHGVLGLVTIILTVLSIALSFAHRRNVSLTETSDTNHPKKIPKKTSKIKLADTITSQAVLLLAGFVLTDGVDDLASMSLCLINIISLSTAVSVGSIITLIYSGAMGVLTLEWWLERRVKTNEKDGGRMVISGPIELKSTMV